MKRAYLLGSLLVACSSTALASESADAQRYEIWFDGNWTIDNGKPEREKFTWIVDEGAPANEQIVHLGKSICEGAVSCSVQIKPYQIRISFTKEGTQSGRPFTAKGEWTIDRVNGVGEFTGSMTEPRGKELKLRRIKGTFFCDRHPFRPEI